MKVNLYIRLSFVLILFIGSLVSLSVLAANGNWFSPGELGFPLQRAGEQLLTLFQNSQQARVNWLISLVVRRCETFANQPEASLINEIEHAIDRAASAYARLPEGGLQKETLRNAAALCELAFEQNPDMKGAPRAGFLESKLHSLRLVLNSASSRPEDVINIIDLLLKTPDPNATLPVGTQIALEDPRLVTFPTDSQGALHTFYPLTGKHAELGCNQCHPSGNYAGTPKQCVDCHEKDTPLNHYDPNCAACHSTVGWQQVTFDHKVVQNQACEKCHQANLPAGHYPGPCSACHTPTSWRQVNFNHSIAGATDCLACHTDKKPANHYVGQCSLCHSTTAWTPATFNHSAMGAIDCVSCHTSDSPANHYAGQCSLCHSNTAWRPATFNHTAVGATDCISCHTNRKPANHYGGQCSQCHTTSTWAFNHKSGALTDCIACHTNRKPANHFNGQCSLCHNTTSWANATFNHTAAGATDCISCHLSKRPANHYDGQCSVCHNTTSWGNASFPHTFPTDHRGANNQCAKCHPVSTKQWTCYVCHNQTEMENHHLEKSITNIATRCLECHPTGRNP